MDDLKLELKKLIIKNANLEDIEPEDIKDQEPLFVEGLGLDSIDALELSVALELAYGINISDSDVAKEAFRTIETLSAFVSQNRKQ